MGLVGLIAYLTPTLAGAVALIYSITLGYDDQVIEGKKAGHGRYRPLLILLGSVLVI
jgi:hypothetical protein